MALMTFEMTDHVPGLDDDWVAALAEEAEADYDVQPQDGEPNPHSQRVRLAWAFHADLGEV